MQNKNDEWIERIQALEADMGAYQGVVYQGTPVGTLETGNALKALTESRFWLQEDKAKSGVRATES
jgi:hypothetical protein